MLIRKAKSEEADILATHLLLAMEDIVYHFIGEKSKEKALLFLRSLIQEKNNQYSYEHCWVLEADSILVATALVYDGALLKTLRKPVVQKIKSLFGRELNPGDETAAGEYYIDCIGVDPLHQGKGYGYAMLHFLIKEYVLQLKQTLGLLVEKDNVKAKQLYLKLGFEQMGEKVFAGKTLEHLQYKYNSVL